MKINKAISAMRSLLVVVAMFAGMTAFAQTTARGVIKGDDGEPLIGASVMIDGTSTGAVTDVNGAFTLPGVRNGQKLKIDCLGYTSQTVVFNGQPINVTGKTIDIINDIVPTSQMMLLNIQTIDPHPLRHILYSLLLSLFFFISGVTIFKNSDLN